MRTAILAGLAALAASTATAQWTNQSAPFYLVLHSSNDTINGSSLGACHEGAAIEGLCLGFPPSQFQFNTSSYPGTPNTTIGEQGFLTYELHGSNFDLSEPMTLSYDPTSNVAVPEFIPDYGTMLVAFDDKNRMNIQSGIDDTTVPPTEGHLKAYYRWYVCDTYEGGYSYTALAWVMGDHSPQNPSCVKVDVVRVFC